MTLDEKDLQIIDSKMREYELCIERIVQNCLVSRLDQLIEQQNLILEKLTGNIRRI